MGIKNGESRYQQTMCRDQFETKFKLLLNENLCVQHLPAMKIKNDVIESVVLDFLGWPPNVILTTFYALCVEPL